MSEPDIYISYRDYGEEHFDIKNMSYENLDKTEKLIEQAEAAICTTDEECELIDDYLDLLDNLLEHQSKFNEYKMARDKLWNIDRSAALNAEYLAKKEAVSLSYIEQKLFVFLNSDKLKSLLPMSMDEDEEYEDDIAISDDVTIAAPKSVNDTIAENLHCRKCGAMLAADSEFCHKCGTKIASSAETVCLHKNSTPMSNIQTQQHNHHEEHKNKKNFFSFDWINDVGDWLSDIPVVGGCLTAIFVILLLGLVLGGILFVLIGSFSLSSQFGTSVFAIGFAVLTYFVCYKWHARRKWMFWLALPASIAMIIASFFF